MSANELKESEISALRRACRCLFAQAPEEVARDIKAKAEAVIAWAEDARRAAVTAPRGDVVDEALGMFKEVYDTVTFLGGETIHIAVGSELANKLIAAAPSSPTPAESTQFDLDPLEFWCDLAEVLGHPRPQKVNPASLVAEVNERLAATPPERTRVEGEQSCPHLRQTFPDTPANRCLDCDTILRANPSGSARRAAEEICAYFGDTELAMGGHVNANGVAAIISKHFAAAQQWRQGMKDAAKEVCDACDNEERYGPARKIEGSTRWWHGDDNIPCEAGGIWHVLAERTTNAAAAPADNAAESLRRVQLPSPAQQALQIVTAWRAVVGGDDLLIHYIKQAIEENRTTTTKGER